MMFDNNFSTPSASMRPRHKAAENRTAGWRQEFAGQVLQ